MRYEDLPYRLETGLDDPLPDNITTENLTAIGVYAPGETVYIKWNANNRVLVNADEDGKFEYVFDHLKVEDSISFQKKQGTQYVEFWQETIRE
ncbi:hypothetical protein HBP99_16080 [Listeria booriae]|uniref:hypothetical protein n=1 Tax=Listeria booriae TaxID=1552123 RepID=UPI001624E142|nr:hypothetical protein [Listeria booriae]MBC2370149.1 hypothetical protein [Listeria booriae]